MTFKFVITPEINNERMLSEGTAIDSRLRSKGTTKLKYRRLCYNFGHNFGIIEVDKRGIKNLRQSKLRELVRDSCALLQIIWGKSNLLQ